MTRTLYWLMLGVLLAPIIGSLACTDGTAPQGLAASPSSAPSPPKPATPSTPKPKPTAPPSPKPAAPSTPKPKPTAPPPPKPATPSTRQDNAVSNWYVYADAASKQNHGNWTNVMPAEGAKMLNVTLVDKTDPRVGKTCVRATVKFLPPNWTGIAVSCTPDYWGEKPSNSAYDLRGAVKLVFYARGDKGGETIQVKACITGDKPFGDAAAIPAATPWITLKKGWNRYELSVAKLDLSRVVTPFCFVTSRSHNDDAEITVFFDHIYYTMGKTK